MTESGQLDLVDLLREHQTTAENGLNALVDALNPQIDANPNDKLLMEMLDVVTDAQESLAELAELLDTMQQRDEEELP
ncbi:MAG: hypothetical protein JOZ41_18775 [Chloroflexi bacterium]|nr:hypothetical protein [Chloroflexota bacterium]